MNTTKQIARLCSLKGKLGSIQAEVNDLVKWLWPIGSTVKFMLRHGQRIPSSGKVVGHCGEHLTVTLPTVNRRGNNTVKRVYWRNIHP